MTTGEIISYLQSLCGNELSFHPSGKCRSDHWEKIPLLDGIPEVSLFNVLLIFPFDISIAVSLHFGCHLCQLGGGAHLIDIDVNIDVSIK